MRHTLAAAAALGLLAGAALAQPMPYATEGQPAYDVGIPAPSAPKVFFLNLLDGEHVRSPFLVEFGEIGMKLAAAGTEKEGLSGHHHLLIDEMLEGEELTQAIPSDARHLHFGDGAISALVELPPGLYRLQLAAGDANHVPHQPPLVSAPLRIVVVE